MENSKTKKRTFFTDIWRKVIALFLAIFAWYAIHKQLVESMPVIELKVPLQIECDDKRVILPEENFEITLKIKNSTLSNKLSPDDFEVKYIVTERVGTIPDGGMNVTLNRGKNFKIRKPLFTTSVGYDINTSFFIDKVSVKTVPVEVKPTGKLQYGKVPQFEVSPEYVQIEGPSAVLMNIHQLYTEEIDISDVMKDTHFDGRLQALPDKVKMFENRVPSISIVANALSAKEIQSYSLGRKLPISILYSTPQRSRLENDKMMEVELTFETDAETIGEIKRLRLKPFLDLSSVSEDSGEIEVPVMLDLPRNVAERVYHVRKEPETFRVKLVPMEEKSQKEEKGDDK
ncbi:MAG: YbbR-like domain-containing protein [Victivallales bacterium]|nr:YbbR-like domain-containing protein [Victivallales bacterium]